MNLDSNFYIYPNFPITRLRRLRKNKVIRDLFQETRLSLKDIVCPIFVDEGINRHQEIDSMPGYYITPLKELEREVEDLFNKGLRSFILFGIPNRKDNSGISAYENNGIIQKSVKKLRENFGNSITIITDVCLCQYTSHGHCGILDGNIIDNDKSIAILSKVAVSHAEAGTDIVAPSAMMDGQVSAIRKGLDERNFKDVSIMGYSAKFASSLYSPFRDAVHSIPEFGDRKTYQMPYPNPREAIREIQSDIQEGADIIMIKPATPYLDLIHQAREKFILPICAYSVSGEYSLIKSAALQNWVDEDSVILEYTTSMIRAGADIIITYYAKKLAEILSMEG